MIYCLYCGTPSDDNSNFCPHCGATLVKPEAAAQQVAPDRQTYTPADGAYAGQTEEDRKQAFGCGSTQTETPTYYYTPCGENMYYAEKAEKKSPGKVPSILSLVFGGVSISFMIEAVGASFAYDPYGAIIALIISMIFALPSISLGIVGLVKSIKARAVPGIVMAAVGLGLTVLAYLLLGFI